MTQSKHLKEVANLRKEYLRAELLESHAPPNPLDLFAQWFHEAVEAELPEPSAMSLATANSQGEPSVRIVLLKGFSTEGFTFYTNYASRKGQDLAENPKASLLFWWIELERQVRITGLVERVPAAESDAYFHSRPYESRLGAWASDQSTPVADRSELEARFADVQRLYPDGQVPRPPHWGGYLLRPTALEFWHGRPSRLHDRLHYELQPGGEWQRSRLAP